MTNIIAITAENERLWQTGNIMPKRQAKVNSLVVRLTAPSAKLRYQPSLRLFGRSKPRQGRLLQGALRSADNRPRCG